MLVIYDTQWYHYWRCNAFYNGRRCSRQTEQLGFHYTHFRSMAKPEESDPPPIETLEFKWGKMRGKGGKKKDTQFYESFTFDGEDYSLYDTVYLQNGTQSQPHIGKIIKIWETPTRVKLRKIKVQWFFRPREISKFLNGIQIYYNELFFACGDGTGLTNINPLVIIHFLISTIFYFILFDSSEF
jgi:hypothetical protein